MMNLQTVFSNGLPSHAELVTVLRDMSEDEKAELMADLEEQDRRDQEERGRFFVPVSPSDPNHFMDVCPQSNDQRGFIHSTADERWVFGGNRSGKTEVAVNDCNMFCLGTHPVRSLHRQPPVKVRMCGPTWRDSVSGVILEKFKEIVPRALLRGGDWRKAWSEKDHKLYYSNGSYVQFKSYEEDRSTYGGANLDAVYEDEASPRDIHEENSSRLADRDGYFVATMTPELGMTWQDDHVKNPPEGVTIEHWFFSMYGNPHLSAGGIKKRVAKITDKRLAEAKIWGRFVPLQGLVIPQFDRAVTVIPDRPLHPSAYRVFCIDFHRKIPAAAMWAAWEPTDDLPNLIVYRTAKLKQDIPEWQKYIINESAGEKIQKWLGDEPDGSDAEDYSGELSALHQFREGDNKLPIMQVSKSAGSFNASIFKLWEMFAADPISKQPRVFIFQSCDHPVELVDGKYHGSLPWELERWQFTSEKKADEENLRERVARVNDHYISDLRYIVNNQPTSLSGESKGPTQVLPPGVKPSQYTGIA